ncbi:hypothetical protein NE237_013394 [Protea cynaroides]|uniref:U6 snRNA-associated Sm-like protein LSm4 n=1 Tax=Protea cynaroides TaxID=273540 RepID=A0A9Q0JYG0_9MAGN|nr:hypothetical protein NE237_013394 [Protea cynaroides]
MGTNPPILILWFYLPNISCINYNSGFLFLCLRWRARSSHELVELKNGVNYNGHLMNCNTWMNSHLREVICTSKCRMGTGFGECQNAIFVGIQSNIFEFQMRYCLSCNLLLLLFKREALNQEETESRSVGRGRGRGREEASGRMVKGMGCGQDDGGPKGRGRGGQGSKSGPSRGGRGHG